MECGVSASTRECYIRDISKFAAYVGGEDKAASANVEALVDYCERLKWMNRSIATVNRFISSARVYYGYLINEGYRADNPAQDLEYHIPPQHGMDILTVQEVERILNAPAGNKRDRAVLELLYATGASVSEFCDLNVSDICVAGGYVVCGGRTIPLYRRTEAAVAEWLEIRAVKAKEKALFVNRSGERISRQSIFALVKKYAAKAKIRKDVSPKTIRDSFAVHMLEGEADAKAVGEILGCKSDAPLSRYASLAKGSAAKKKYGALESVMKERRKRSLTSWRERLGGA